MNIEIDPSDYTGSVRDIADLTVDLLSHVAGCVPDESGRVEVFENLYDDDRRIAEVVVNLLDLVCPYGEVTGCANQLARMLKLAATRLEWLDRQRSLGSGL